MSEEEEYSEVSVNEYNLLDNFTELSFTENWKAVFDGLKQPPDTGAYKWARFQIKRLLAPISAVVVPALMLLMVGLLATIQPEQKFSTVMVIEPEPVEELDPIKEEIIPPIDPPEPENIITEIVTDNPYAGSDPLTPGPAAEYSPQPTTFDTVAITKSPIIMRGIYGGRTPGARGQLIAGNGGGQPQEFAVLRALRWMAKTQSSDGSWGATKPAMTALALLSFLAHGETPGSEEFGHTVELAMKYLLECAGTGGGKLRGTDGHEYAFPIVAYALCESYGMTKIPDIEYVAERMLERIITGQHPSGGWNYNLDNSTRDDTSYMGWCAQALKAAKVAGFNVDGLEEACKKSVAGFQNNFGGGYDGGGFGYVGPSKDHGLSPVGTLCMQLHGAANKDAVLGSIRTYDNNAKWQAYDLDNPSVGSSSLYYWYYLTQVKFLVGGETWKRWNALFSPELVRKQNVVCKEQSGYVDHKGQQHSIGYWNQYSGHGANEGDIFPTVLATLQLEVYYRYLPSLKIVAAQDEPMAGVGGEQDGDIKINL